MAEMINRDAPLSGLSSLMAMKGRQGDTELIHMTKPEIAGLAALGKLTINPDTGLPEAFSFKQFLPALAGIAATAMTGGGAAGILLPALAAGGTSAVVNKGDIGAIAFDALLAGAGGALAGAGALGTNAAGQAAGTGGMEAGARASGEAAGEAATLAAGETALGRIGTEGTIGSVIGQEGFKNLSPEFIKNVGAKELGAEGVKQAGAPTLSGQIAGFFSDNVTKELANIGGVSITPDKIAKAGLRSLPTAGLMATGMPTTGGGMLESMKVDTPEIAARKAAESSYGTRAADEIRQPAKVDGLTTQEVLSSALGRSDPLTYLSGSRPSNVSSPSNLYGGSSGVTGQPVRGAGPVGGYVPQAASGGSLQDLYERMGGDIQTFKGLVEGGEIGSDGMSDDIEFDVIDGGEEGPDNALLSKDEYVIDAHTVAALGNGSTDAGADRLDKFVANLRNKAYNKGKQPEQLNGLKELATLMS
jgi:hypothetical protein